ncbi:MAG: phosphoglycerate kinase [Patescibacteria group bacterium]
MKTLRLTPVKDLNVLVRMDLDLPELKGKWDTTRLEHGIPTLVYLYRNEAKHVKVIAHLGRPKGKVVKKLSLKPIAKLLYQRLLEDKAFKKLNAKDLEKWLEVGENLRFDEREETPNNKFAKELKKGYDLFVFEAFADSHRDHTSVTRVTELMPTVTGIQFYKEITVLKKLLKKPKSPFVVILGGGKPETKIPLINPISERANVILVGGQLPLEMSYEKNPNSRLIIGELRKDGLDLADETCEQFERFIVQAETIVWNGPMGKYEDPKSRKGTAYIADVVARTRGFKIIGGGDTEAAVSLLKIDQLKSFTHVCTGGGAMLDYLAKGTLPFLEALEHSEMEH